MNAIELFSGAGVSAWGLVAAGHNLVDAIDMSPVVVRAFNSQ